MRFVAVLVLLVGVTACSGDDAPEDSGPLIIAEASEVYPAALLTGTLTMTHDCLAVGGLPAVWPPGTTWDEAQQSVTVAGSSQAFKVGEALRLGGGAIPFLDGFPEAVSDDAAKKVLACNEYLDVSDLAFIAPGEVPQGEGVDLPTSEWTPGNGGDGAGIEGVLSIDNHRCVYLDNDGEKTWAVWPKDYTASDTEGRLELMDPSGEVVAVEGDDLFLGGGYTSDYEPLTGKDCVPDGVELALVQTNIDGSNS